MSHYFTEHDSEHEYKIVNFTSGGRAYRFKTDRGVFSRDRIDYGSRVLIEAVISDLEPEAPEGTFIDMGAGYGPIGIVIGDALGMKPIMVEVNPDALSVCRENAEENDVPAEVHGRDAFDGLTLADDLSFYVTNPPFRAGKPVVLDMIEDAGKRLPKGRPFYMVVQKKQGMPSYKKAIEEKVGSVETVIKDKGYYVLKGIRS